MGDTRNPENFFYDSDEDVAWGPRSFREVKRDLKRDRTIPKNYRRQTASFIPCPAENKSIANSSHSSKDYFTANESLESNNIQSTEANTATAASTIDTEIYSSNDSSCKFSSCKNKMDKSKCSEVIELSSDSENEDLNIDLELPHVKTERFSRSQSTKYNSFSTGELSDQDVICLSSSEDEETEACKENDESFEEMQDTSIDSLDGEQTPKIQSIANTPVKESNYSPNQSRCQDLSLSNKNEANESGKMSRLTPRIRIIAKTPVKRNKESLNSSFIDGNENSAFATKEMEISRTPLKHLNHPMNQDNSSFTRNQQTDWISTETENISDDKIVGDSPEKELNYSSDNFCYRDHFIAQESDTLKAERQIPTINIISNTPIKGPGGSSINDSTTTARSSVDNYQKPEELSDQSEDCIEANNDTSENKNASWSPSSNTHNFSFTNEAMSVSFNASLYKSANLSQNENEYDYCEEVNHTLSSKIESDFSLKNSDDDYNTACNQVASNELDISGIQSIPTSSFNYTKNYDYCEEVNHTLSSKLESDFSLKNSDDDYNTACNLVASNTLDISGIQSIPTSSFNYTKNDSLVSNEWKGTRNASINSKELHNTRDDSMADNEDSCLDDTLAEMERLLSKGFDSDSDDSLEEIVDSTSYNPSRPAFGNSSIKNISRIPVPKSFSDDSKSISASKDEFKIPKPPHKVIKKTPVGSRLANKTSPIPFKNIVSPVRLYINNSPVAVLKQTNKPICTKSERALGNLSESTICIPKKRRNLLSSLPPVVYKPSKLVMETCDDQIILPNNIRKLITERIVIKHEPRKRINPDESMFSIGDKLEMGDLSVIVNDERNMSVHNTKQGFNL